MMDMEMSNCSAYFTQNVDDIKSYVEAGMNALTSNLEMMYGVSGNINGLKVAVVSLKDVDYMGMIPSVICKAMKSDSDSVPFIVIFKQQFLRELVNVATGNMNGTMTLTFDDFDLSTGSEVISQVFNSFGSALSLMTSRPISAYNCETKIFNNYGDLIQAIKVGSDDKVVNITCLLGFEGFTNNEINIVVNVDILREFLAIVAPKEEVAKAESAPTPPPAPAANVTPVIKGDASSQADNTINNNYVMSESDNSILRQPFSPQNMQLLMNIPLEMSVQIGSTMRPIKDICEFTNGTVIELQKPVSETVDIYANDKMIAHGDVVVIDDNFGVQITEVLDIKKIIAALTGDEE